MATALDDPRIVEFDVRTDEMLVNMGPQHPSTHGVLRLVLRTDGEIVSRSRAAYRLSASLRGEDRREPHAAAVDSVHRPDGLSGRDEHESRLVAVRREAAQPSDSRKGPPPARDHCRDAAGSPATWSAWGRMASTWARSARSSTPSANGNGSSTCSKKPAALGSPTATSRPAGRRPICPRAGCKSARRFSTSSSRSFRNITRCSRRTRSSSSARPTSACSRPRWPSTTAAPGRCCAAAASITISAATAKSGTPKCTTAMRSK